MSTKILFVMLALVPAGVMQVQAAPVRIYSNVSSPMNDVSYSAAAQAVRTGGLTIVLHVTCFGTNLRSVPYPLARNSDIVFMAKIDDVSYSILFPAGITQSTIYDTGTPIPPAPIAVNSPPDAVGSAVGNTVYIRSNQSVSIAIINSDGTYSPEDRAELVTEINFKQQIQRLTHASPAQTQRVYAIHKDNTSWFQEFADRALNIFKVFSSLAYASYGGGFDDHVFEDYPTDGGDTRGYEDNITAHYSYAWSTDFRTLEFNAAFPGQRDYCGSYVSPLMLFFGGERPRFKNTAQFNMGSHPHTYWPEAGAPGFFLAIDKNADGRINDVSELFGSLNKSSNGFEALRQYDTNKDGAIDKRDRQFSQLLLWSDRNGDGVSRPDEIVSLRDKGVTAISLNYRADQREPLGQRAELRERSTFKYREGLKIRTGAIIDVWLSSTGR